METNSSLAFAHKLFSVPEAAEHLRISRTMVFKLIRQGHLVPAKIGRRTLISGRMIEQLISCRNVEQDSNSTIRPGSNRRAKRKNVSPKNPFFKNNND